MDGWLVIDKPAGMTSRDAVNRVQRLLPRRTKIGHTGTLDPLATGVLVLCIGAATKQAEHVQAMGKVYESRFRLGARSDTDDADGMVINTPDTLPPSELAVRQALAEFVGVVNQVPPAYSALKVDGRRAHMLARTGSLVQLPARPVRIDAIEFLDYRWPVVDVRIHCGKGTYVRSIARDLGEKLAVGGLVVQLRRTQVGPFTVASAVGLDLDPQTVRTRLLPLAVTAPRVDSGPTHPARPGRVWSTE